MDTTNVVYNGAVSERVGVEMDVVAELDGVFVVFDDFCVVLLIAVRDFI
jgi:hypothetical protein